MRPRFFYLGRKMKRVLGYRLRGCKERGEWAELCFMARAAENGLRVSKPYGESASCDVGVEHKGTILRVQVKSTIYYRRGGSFSLNVLGPKRKKYPSGVLDFFAVYLIPIDTWYIIPFEVIGLACTLRQAARCGRNTRRIGRRGICCVDAIRRESRFLGPKGALGMTRVKRIIRHLRVT